MSINLNINQSCPIKWGIYTALDQFPRNQKASHPEGERLLVPLTLQFSNSFMSNIKEIYGLRSLMISEGLMTNDHQNQYTTR